MKRQHTSQLLATSTDSAFLVLLPVVILALLCLAQGGYYAISAYTVCAVGLICYVIWRCVAGQRISICHHRVLRDPLFILLAAMPLLYAISGVLHGVLLSAIATSAPWVLMAIAYGMISLLSEQGRKRTLYSITWWGIVLAAVSIVLMLMPSGEGIFRVAGRLLGPFQYANAAGVFFAVATLLAITATDRKLRVCSLIPLVALVLTRSIGSLVCLAIGAVLYLACTDSQMRRSIARSAKVPLCIAALLLILLALWLGTDLADAVVSRLVQAQQTFTERIIQVMDAGTLLAASPVLGAGPGMWRYLYPFVQTAQYTASVLHCGPVQAVLDVGFAAACVLLSMVFLVGRRFITGRRGEKAQGSSDLLVALCALVVLSLHFCMDIDIRFSSLAFLAGLLLRCGMTSGVQGCDEQQVDARDEHEKSSHRFPAFAIFSLLLCCAGVAVSSREMTLQQARDNSGADMVIAAREDPLTSKDPVVQLAHVRLLYANADYESIEEVAEEVVQPLLRNIPGARQGLGEEAAFIVASARYAEGDALQAESVFLDELTAEPFNESLYERVAQLFDENGLSATNESRYKECVQRANAYARTGRAAWLNNQKDMAQATL